MCRSTRVVRRAFSLIELMVTVSVIGIISAIAVPRLSSAAARSGPAVTRRDMAVLQRQMEIYAAEHGGVYPAAAGDGANAAHTEAALISQLTLYTDINGRSDPRPSATFRLGPYLRKGVPPIQVGPHRGSTKVQVVTGTTALVFDRDLEAGWLYNDRMGKIVPNAPGIGTGEVNGEVRIDVREELGIDDADGGGVDLGLGGLGLGVSAK